MPYTVKQLAKLSGVSVRTLHYYDEIALLSPAYYGDNHYRYYEEEQLLMLQQILFYKELGFPLGDIQKILKSEHFDKIEALQSHRNLLTGDIDRIHKLINTIDKTISHLKGKPMFELEEIFDGFTDEKQAMYLDFLVESGISKESIEECKEKVKHWSKEQWVANKQENDKLYANIVGLIKKNLSPSSKEVQVLIKKHYELTKVFWTPTRESYIGLGQLYLSNPDFVAFYDEIHPKLLDFLIEAMNLFADKNLS
ncbi:MAG: transcriptional regulator [marine bacterium B5-7]|nr:MAG: transcriptional regulator [marine bacterium B5-7]